MNRGNLGEDIFLTDKDRKVFLDGLADSCKTYRIKLIAYVLMSNHFHLLVQTPQANPAANAQTEDLRDRKTKLKDLRQMAMELSYRYSNYTQKEIGVNFGVDYSTVSQNRARLKTKLKTSRKLKKQFYRIQVQFDKLSNSKI